MSNLSKVKKEKLNELMEKRYDYVLSKCVLENNIFKKNQLEKDLDFVLDKWSSL